MRSSHERFDGGGYPDGLVGEEIPIESRIVFCCDAYNAMTTDRAYRRRAPRPTALAELRDNAGTQFDPRSSTRSSTASRPCDTRTPRRRRASTPPWSPRTAMDGCSARLPSSLVGDR